MNLTKILDDAFLGITGLNPDPFNSPICAYCKSTEAKSWTVKGTVQVLHFCTEKNCSGAYLGDYGSLSFYQLDFPFGPTVKIGQQDWMKFRDALIQKHQEEVSKEL